MKVLPTCDEVLDILFRRDAWLWLKIPAAAALAWLFLLPQLWKIAVILVASIVCIFVYPCPVGPSVTEAHLAVMFLTLLAVVVIVLAYSAYVVALVCRASWLSRLLGVIGMLLSPIFLIVVALLAGVVELFFRVPLEEIWAFLDSWTPIAAWKVLE